MEASRCTAVGVRVIGGIVWKRPARVRRVWPWGWKGGVGVWRRGRPRVVAPSAYVWRPAWGESPESRGRAPCGRHSRPGGASTRPCPSSWSSPAGPRMKRHAVGLDPASAAAARARTGRRGAPRRRDAWSSCMPVRWPSSRPRRMSGRKRRPRRPLPTRCGRGPPRGWPAGPRPRPPAPPRRARDRAAVGAGRAPGALTRAALASWQRGAARGGLWPPGSGGRPAHC